MAVLLSVGGGSDLGIINIDRNITRGIIRIGDIFSGGGVAHLSVHLCDCIYDGSSSHKETPMSEIMNRFFQEIYRWIAVIIGWGGLASFMAYNESGLPVLYVAIGFACLGLLLAGVCGDVELPC